MGGFSSVCIRSTAMEETIYVGSAQQGELQWTREFVPNPIDKITLTDSKVHWHSVEGTYFESARGNPNYNPLRIHFRDR